MNKKLVFTQWNSSVARLVAGKNMEIRCSSYYKTFSSCKEHLIRQELFSSTSSVALTTSLRHSSLIIGVVAQERADQLTR